MSIYALLAGRGPSGFGYGSTAEEVSAGVSLSGKTYLVTGASSGIGFETARVLALRGARVLVAARTLEKASATCAKLSGAGLAVACELSDSRSVRECVATIARAGVALDGVICNAGVMAVPKLQLVHGYELQFFTNHLSHFLLVTSLVDALAAEARVVVVSSELHERAPVEGIDFDNLAGERHYSPWEAYGRSKLANILFAKQLARRFAGSARTANAVHPGVIRTGLQRHLPSLAGAAMSAVSPLFLKSVEQGAATQTYVAVRPELAVVSGQYFTHCNVGKPRTDADDEAPAQKLWDASERIIARLP